MVGARVSGTGNAAEGPGWMSSDQERSASRDKGSFLRGRRQGSNLYGGQINPLTTGTNKPYLKIPLVCVGVSEVTLP